MDVKNLSAQVYTPAMETRAAEPAGDTVESAAKTEQVSAEPEKAAAVDEENGVTDETNLDDRQLEDILAKRVKEANQKLTLSTNELHYSYHKATRTVAVKVVNSNTQEVVREIPPQKALDAIAKIWELAGILVDEKK